MAKLTHTLTSLAIFFCLAPGGSGAAELGQGVSSPAVEGAEGEARPVNTARAASIIYSSAQFLASQPLFAVQWDMTSDEVVDGRELVTTLQSGTVTMDRSRGFIARTERGSDRRDYFYDGAEFTVAAPEQKFYATSPFAGGYDKLVRAVEDRTGTSLPLWSMLSPNLPETLLEGAENVTYRGATFVGGRPAHHLSFTSLGEEWQVWISTDLAAPLPLMLIGTDKEVGGWPQYRVSFKDWDLSPKVNKAMFRFRPGSDFEKISMPPLSSSAGDSVARPDNGSQDQ